MPFDEMWRNRTHGRRLLNCFAVRYNGAGVSSDAGNDGRLFT